MQPLSANSYQQIALDALPRLLNVLDRNSQSPTFGCFDRSYWLHRKSDFPQSTAQMSMRSLALFYKTPFPGNFLARNPTALSWIEAALRYTLSIQHKDGSFDEWYPNERGWAGPTGYVAHAIVETMELLQEELPKALQAKTKQALKRAAHHLLRRDEKEILANHYAIAILPILEIGHLLNDKEILDRGAKALEFFKTLVSSEGWSLEYDGCDIGYNLGTLDFLADLHKRTKNSYLLEYAKKSFSFLSHFAYPDGTWAGSLGSRHTSHSYPFALEYWSKLLPEARPLLNHQRQSIIMGKAILPSHQEDHYLHYRLADYLKAAASYYPENLQNYFLPYENPNFSSASFPEAGLHLEATENHLLWIAYKRGGVFRLHERKGGKLLAINGGVQIMQSNGKLLSSLWQNKKGESPWRIQAPLQPIFSKRFTPASFLLFRLACAAMFFPWAAYWFKWVIRKNLITHQKLPASSFKREVILTKEKLEVKDQIDWKERTAWEKLSWGGEFHTRYVPQGQYFTGAEADFVPYHLSPTDFKNRQKPTVRWELTFSENKANLCVE